MERILVQNLLLVCFECEGMALNVALELLYIHLIAEIPPSLSLTPTNELGDFNLNIHLPTISTSKQTHPPSPPPPPHPQKSH